MSICRVVSCVVGRGKGEKERYTHLPIWMQSSKEYQGEIRKPSAVNSAKKWRKTIEWERLEISNFLEVIFSPYHSVVFLYFFALITEEGLLFSPCCSLELCIQMAGCIFPFPIYLSLLFFSAICKASSDNHIAFLHFFFLEMVFDHRLLYNVMNFHPWFFRHSVYQI